MWNVLYTAVASVIVLLIQTSAEHVCSSVGYFPEGTNCSIFYRCTDIWNNSLYQQYTFQCAPGTVFDDSLDVCNWPWAVPGCLDGAAPLPPAPTTLSPAPLPPAPSSTSPPASLPPAPTTLPPAPLLPSTTFSPEPLPPINPVNPEEAYIPSPDSPYPCQLPGVNPFPTDCQKFWLCKEIPPASRQLQALLYRCPEGYLFSSASLRCAKKANVACTSGSGLPDFRSVPVTQLIETELEAFFSTWG